MTKNTASFERIRNTFKMILLKNQNAYDLKKKLNYENFYVLEIENHQQ